jgi:hypothetical protein
VVLHGIAAALAATVVLTLPSELLARGEWPDGPNKAWFEALQRTDNDPPDEPIFQKETTRCVDSPRRAVDLLQPSTEVRYGFLHN